ncbi:phosphoribosyltransferase family protein [Dactylosporangium sp. NPDC000244]|uniref:ComF family protein n=1 Tax=Dactylosporangium sp. NPDC000244 TaxID=3154365 RepID=UPI003324F8E3
MTFALAAYAGAVRRAIVQYKEKNRHELSGVLGAQLGRVVDRAVAGGPVVLVPVPATAAAVRRRHGDHMLRLARAAARGRPGVAIARPLRALPRHDDSAELTAARRAVAARHAFAVRPRPAAALRALVNREGAAVVLLDDIVTTGVTLAAAAERLAGAGVRVDGAAVLAATQRDGTRRGGAKRDAVRGFAEERDPVLSVGERRDAAVLEVSRAGGVSVGAVVRAPAGRSPVRRGSERVPADGWLREPADGSGRLPVDGSAPVAADGSERVSADGVVQRGSARLSGRRRAGWTVRGTTLRQ